MKIRGTTVTTPIARGAVTDDKSVSQKAWSSKHTVDKLCPAFEDEGTVVQCEPIEGYPLKVVTALPEMVGSITLTQCGKNLYDKNNYTLVDNYIIYASSGGLGKTSSKYNAVEDYIPVGHLKGYTITLNHAPNDEELGSAGLCFYDAEKKYIKGSGARTHLVPDNAEYMRFSVSNKYQAEEIQIEIGDVFTTFEQYKGTVYTANPTGQLHEWVGVKAMAGINTLWSSVGETTVEGKADPVVIIDKLTKAVLSLGGNI